MTKQPRRAAWVGVALALATVIGLLVGACQSTGGSGTAAATRLVATAAAPTVASVATKPAAAATKPAAAATTTQATAGAANTAGALAQRGTPVYERTCASCHGANGEGVTAPAVWGAGASFGRFATAKDLDSYIRTNMPLDKPASLSQDEYTQLTALVLLKNNLVREGDAFDAQKLDAIQVRK